MKLLLGLHRIQPTKSSRIREVRFITLPWISWFLSVVGFNPYPGIKHEDMSQLLVTRHRKPIQGHIRVCSFFPADTLALESCQLSSRAELPSGSRNSQTLQPTVIDMHVDVSTGPACTVLKLPTLGLHKSPCAFANVVRGQQSLVPPVQPSTW